MSSFILFTLTQLLLLTNAIYLKNGDVSLIKSDSGFHLNVKTDGKSLEANLQKTLDHESVLGNDFHFLIADVDASGKQTFDRWTPSKSHVDEASKHVYIDREAQATFIIKPEGNDHQVNGRMHDLVLEKSGGEFRFVKQEARSDAIAIPTNLAKPNGTQILASGKVEAIAEYVIVPDYSLCRKFGHDYQKILEYFIVHMWDMNLRFKSLPSTKFSFQLNGLVLIASEEAQPFFKESRDAKGRSNYGRLLHTFAKWVKTNKNSLPPLDVTSLVCDEYIEDAVGGCTFQDGACTSSEEYYYGSSIWTDWGSYSFLNVPTHELGHNVGAFHDTEGPCSEGFIMSGNSDAHRFFFSSCSDKFIGNFVRSEAASCLRTLTTNKPATSPEFDSPPAPTMLEQCRKQRNDNNAWITKVSCYNVTCNYEDAGKISSYSHPVLDNSPCANGGRCFRGKCRQRSNLIANVASGLCMEAPGSFIEHSTLQMVTCPRVGTALSRFLIAKTRQGVLLQIPFVYKGQESLEKCVYPAATFGDIVTTDFCRNTSDVDNLWRLEWKLVNVGRNEFLLKHLATDRCAMAQNKQVGSLVYMHPNCPRNDALFRWTRVD